MKLRYIGKTIDQVGVVPLPEGWPAEDHDELDAEVGKAKVRFGAYEKVGKDAEEKE